MDLLAQIAAGLTATADPDAGSQVVLNLPDNAITYASSGRVRLSTHRTAPDDDEVRIAVSDSGPGIPAEHLPHIFDHFYRVFRFSKQASVRTTAFGQDSWLLEGVTPERNIWWLC